MAMAVGCSLDQVAVLYAAQVNEAVQASRVFTDDLDVAIGLDLWRGGITSENVLKFHQLMSSQVKNVLALSTHRTAEQILGEMGDTVAQLADYGVPDDVVHLLAGQLMALHSLQAQQQYLGSRGESS